MLLSCVAGSQKQPRRIKTVKSNHTNSQVSISFERRCLGRLEVDSSGDTALTGDNSVNSAVTDTNHPGHKVNLNFLHN